MFRRFRTNCNVRTEIVETIDGLNYDFSDFRIISFVKHVERWLDIEINLHPTVTGKHAAGLRLSRDGFATIFIEPRDSYLMQQFHILHEMGHIIRMIVQGRYGYRYRFNKGNKTQHHTANEKEEIFAEMFAHEVTRKLIEVNGESVLENQEPTMQLLAVYYREMKL